MTIYGPKNAKWQDLLNALKTMTPEELQEDFKLHAEGYFFKSFIISRLTEGETSEDETPEDNWLVLEADGMVD